MCSQCLGPTCHLPPPGKLAGLMRPEKVGSVLERATPALYLGPPPQLRPSPHRRFRPRFPAPSGASQCRLSTKRMEHGPAAPESGPCRGLGFRVRNPPFSVQKLRSRAHRAGTEALEEEGTLPAGLRSGAPGRSRPQVQTGAPLPPRRSWPRLCVRRTGSRRGRRRSEPVARPRAHTRPAGLRLRPPWSPRRGPALLSRGEVSVPRGTAP